MSQSGRVKFYSFTKGFGFIETPAGDMFMHSSGINGNPPREGDMVTYELFWDERKQKQTATQVTGGSGYWPPKGKFEGGKGKDAGGGKGKGKGKFGDDMGKGAGKYGDSGFGGGKSYGGGYDAGKGGGYGGGYPGQDPSAGSYGAAPQYAAPPAPQAYPDANGGGYGGYAAPPAQPVQQQWQDPNAAVGGALPAAAYGGYDVNAAYAAVGGAPPAGPPADGGYQQAPAVAAGGPDAGYGGGYAAPY